jgi:hypothetical protein
MSRIVRKDVKAIAAIIATLFILLAAFYFFVFLSFPIDRVSTRFKPIILKGSLASDNAEHIRFVEEISETISSGALETLI